MRSRPRWVVRLSYLRFDQPGPVTHLELKNPSQSTPWASSGTGVVWICIHSVSSPSRETGRVSAQARHLAQRLRSYLDFATVAKHWSSSASLKLNRVICERPE
jgi:hypothetical protein